MRMNASASCGRPRDSRIDTRFSTAAALLGERCRRLERLGLRLRELLALAQHPRQQQTQRRQRAGALELLAQQLLGDFGAAGARQERSQRSPAARSPPAPAAPPRSARARSPDRRAPAEPRQVELRAARAAARAAPPCEVTLGLLPAPELRRARGRAPAQLESPHAERLRASERGERLLGTVEARQQRAEPAVRAVPVAGIERERLAVGALGLGAGGSG